MKRTRVLLLILLLAAAAARAVYFEQVRGQNPYFTSQVADCKYYDDWALALARGDAPARAFYQPPLYPYLLGGVYFALDACGALEHRFAVVYALQCLLGLASLWFTYRLGARWFGPAAGLLGAALLGLYASFQFWELKLLISPLEIALTTWSLWRLALAETSAKQLLMAGAALGLLVLARADKLAFVPLALVWLGATRGRGLGRLRAPALVLLPVLVAAGGATLRNAVVAGDPVVIAANGGINFWFGNQRGASGINMAPDVEFGSLFTQADVARARAERRLGRPLGDAEVSRFWYGEGLESIRRQPREWLALELRKLRLALSDLEADIGWLPEAERPLARVLGLLPVPFGLLLGLGLAGLAVHARRKETWLLALAVAATYAVLLAFFMGARFRLAAAPPLAVLSGAALAWCGARLWQRRFAAALLVPAVALPVAAYAAHEGRHFTNPGQPRPLREQLLANTTQILGQAFADQRQPLLARETFERVLEFDPESFKALFCIGRIDLARARELPAGSGGEPGERRSALLRSAEDALRRSLALFSAFPDTRRALAEVLAEPEIGKFAEAAALCEALAKGDPKDLGMRLLWARALLAAGRERDARVVLDELVRLAPQDPQVAELRRRLRR